MPDYILHRAFRLMELRHSRLNTINIVTILCFLFCLPFQSPTSATSLSNETDLLSLLAFKDVISQKPLGELSSWNSSLHFCNWKGVSCDDNLAERVTGLNLQSQNLSGKLSPFVGNLSFLRVLSLSGNYFHGKIPYEINRLFNLEVLLMANNSFNGEIPNNMTNLSNLRYLSLYGNALSGTIPAGISYLENLVQLNLASNNLVGDIPPSLGNLTFLTNMYLSSNHLVGEIPGELSQLHKLETLDLDLNFLNGTIPHQLYNLSNVYTFSVMNNLLEGSLPLDFCLTLPKLQKLGLGVNRFLGPIPESLINCSQLVDMDFAYNHISGKVPLGFGSLQHLRLLNLGNNRFGSDDRDDLNFLSSLSNCTKLEVMAAAGNSFRGYLPESIGNLSSALQVFIIGGNYIHGKIPSGIRYLNNLRILDIQFNRITGGIPDGVGKLQRLQTLYLNDNKLSGRIPPSLGNLRSLEILMLGDNGFYGSIPLTLWNCHSLFHLDISDNVLTGHLSLQIGNLNNLVVLDVSSNKFLGKIPGTLGKCMNLMHLSMKENNLEGTIPPTFIALKSMYILDVSRNNLSELIPLFLENLTLSTVDLSFNDFEGPVPQEGIFRYAVVIHGNIKLCGGIPELRLPGCHVLASTKHKKSSSLVLKAAFPAVGILLFVLVFLSVIFHKRRQLREKYTSMSLFDRQYFRVSYSELLIATNSFSEDNLIGVGSFSSVYKGILDHEESFIAVKVLNLQQHGGSKSFLSECKALRNARHRNLVRILTSCSSVDFKGNDFKALVFEFMPNGNIDRWLYAEVIDEQGVLQIPSFAQRINVTIDVALALEYLHHECESVIFHCDLKPSNILLDREMTAHVSDFGIAKVVSNPGQSRTSSSSAIKGSIGYVPPEYGLGANASAAGDIYSYGILLMELFTCKKPTSSIFKDGQNLHNLVKNSLPDKMGEIMDNRLLLAEDVQESLVSIMRIGVACSLDSPKDRMHIKEVVKQLSLIRAMHQRILPV